MPRMSAIDLRALLNAERTDAMSAITASKLAEKRATALDYYQGDMSKYMPAPDGRSKAVSTDTSDTIEGLMPTLMEIFAGGEEVVQFEPHGPQDVAAAEQETDYVNHVFMQGNPGFLILYSFIKDALLSKVGVVKIFWEMRDEKERETYLDQPPDAFAALMAAPEVEIVEHSEHDGLHDITIEANRTVENARVVAVPPEEFGISRHARTIRESDYCFHDVFKSESALILQGYDKDQVKRLPSYIVAHTVEEISRDTVDESTLRQGEDNINTANRLIRVTEHYVKLDYEGNDDARLFRVTTAGEEGELLLRDGEPDVIEEDHIPFAAMTPVIQTHRFSAAPSRTWSRTSRSRRPRCCAACSTTSTCTTTRAWKSPSSTPWRRRWTICWCRGPAALCAPRCRAASSGRKCPTSRGASTPRCNTWIRRANGERAYRARGKASIPMLCRTRLPPSPIRCSRRRKAR
jgi:hypothetical protein